jgi:RNA polymerase sigma-54 factor
MRLEMTMTPHLEMIQKLSPQMIQRMEILQMSIMALQQRIQKELQENPVLETSADGQTTDEETTPTDETEDDSGDEFDRVFRDALEDPPRLSRNGLDDLGQRKNDVEQNLPCRPPSLHEYLTDQLPFLDCTKEQLRLMRFLITHIGGDGYLRVATQEIAKSYDQPVSVVLVEEVLRMVQTLDPLGIGARNEKECLLLQLTPQTPHHEVLRVLITNHLEDIAHNRLPAIERRTNLDLATIKAAIEALKHHLNPKPGAQFTHENTTYVVPDIEVKQTENGDYEVRLLEEWMPSIYISRSYLEMYRDKRADRTTKEFVKHKIQAAKWLIESIEQRRRTVERVTKAIIQHQRSFLDWGPEFVEPLKMQQIADQVGVHVTTVSRAVDDKWVQTPRGVFALRRFFGGGTHTTSGEEVAWEKIKQKLLEIVEKEDKSNPLSDDDLVIKLQEAGYPVARRTVTKYRKMLDIASSRERRQY